MTGSPGVVLAGGGLAAVAAARSIRGAGYDGGLTLVTDEEREPYDRPPLSKKYLTGAVGAEALPLLRPGEADQLGLRILCGRQTVGLDTGRRALLLCDGTELSYTALLVATGAEARRLPPAEGLSGVHYLRSQRDAGNLAASLQGGGRITVIGAGFIGLEVAATARSLGLGVTVLEAAPAALTRVLGSRGGELVTRLHRERGVEFHFGVRDLRLAGQDRVRTVHFGVNGDRISLPSGTVVVGIGASPRVGWLAGSTLDTEGGLLCDSAGRTSVPGVYAAGDVSRWHNELTQTTRRVEQWLAALEQGTVAGATIAADLGVPGARPGAWSSVPYFWSDQYEHKLQFCGTSGTITCGKQTRRGWVACHADSQDGPITGVLALDSPATLARGRRLVAERVPWPDAVAWLDEL